MKFLACLAGVRKGREIRAPEEGELGNASKDAIVFSVFHPEILSVKILIGQINLVSIFDLLLCPDWLKLTSRQLSNLIDRLRFLADFLNNFEFVSWELLLALETSSSLT